MWQKDSQIDDVLLDESSLKIPQLHHKYLTLRSEMTLLLKKKQQELRTAEHKKWLYYSGKAPPEDYEDEPFEHRVIKSDIQHWVGVDELIQRIEMQIEYYVTVVNALAEILKQVHQLSYNIKNAIEWRRFTNGV